MVEITPGEPLDEKSLRLLPFPCPPVGMVPEASPILSVGSGFSRVPPIPEHRSFYTPCLELVAKQALGVTLLTGSPENPTGQQKSPRLVLVGFHKNNIKYCSYKIMQLGLRVCDGLSSPKLQQALFHVLFHIPSARVYLIHCYQQIPPKQQFVIIISLDSVGRKCRCGGAELAHFWSICLGYQLGECRLGTSLSVITF